MTPEKKLEWINERIAEGMTVYMATYTQVRSVKASTVRAFARADAELFKISGKSLYVARGRSWDCIDGCKITAS